MKKKVDKTKEVCNTRRAHVIFQAYDQSQQFIHLSIIGKPCAKKNRKRIAYSRRTHKAWMYTDPDVVEYTDSIRRSFLSNKLYGFSQLQGAIAFSAQVWFPTQRGDTDNALQTVFDALETLVYKNDNLVRRCAYYARFVDKVNPRIEIAFWEDHVWYPNYDYTFGGRAMYDNVGNSTLEEKWKKSN